MRELKTCDSKGWFKPGYSGGPGRPRCAAEQDSLRALAEAVSMETWQRIIDTAVNKVLERRSHSAYLGFWDNIADSLERLSGDED